MLRHRYMEEELASEKQTSEKYKHDNKCLYTEVIRYLIQLKNNENKTKILYQQIVKVN